MLGSGGLNVSGPLQAVQGELTLGSAGGYPGYLMDDQVIDLQEYLDRRPDSRRTSFAVWGGEGERSRFALPLWRAIYLVEGDRGGLLWLDENTGRVHPFFVLDLASESPRTEFDPDLLDEVRGPGVEAPALAEIVPGGVTVYLGAKEGRRWFLVVDDGGMGREELQARHRDDLLFLAGECAGLLFHRDLWKE